MFRLSKKPEWLLSGIPFLFFLITRTGSPDRTIDIHIHDTMYVIAVWHIFLLLLIPMLFYTLMHYYLLRKSWRNAKLCSWHAWVSVFSLLVICILLVWPLPDAVSDTLTIEQWKDQRGSQKQVGIIMTGVLFVFGLMQLLFLLYFIAGLLRNGFTSKVSR